MNKSSSKGSRIIILHAITHKQPLAQKRNGIPIESVYFKDGSDTPRFLNDPDGLLTVECMWKSTTSTGDYYDNMNSEMFMNWVTQKLVLTFEAENEGKKMILILDNAAYHHKRDDGSLASSTKAELKILCDCY